MKLNFVEILMSCRRHAENYLEGNTGVFFSFFLVNMVVLSPKESIISFIISHTGFFIQKLCDTLKRKMQKRWSNNFLH